MTEYLYVTIDVTGNEAKHTAFFTSEINRYAQDGWKPSQMVRPSIMSGPLGVLFEREGDSGSA